MAIPFNAIAKGLEFVGNVVNSIFTSLGDILDYINPLSDNFILKDVLDFLLELLSYINPFSDNFILIDVISFLSNILSYINPFNENFLGYKIIELFSNLLKYLFVPSQDHFSELEEIINSKFGIVNQVKELLDVLFNFNRTRSVEQAPSFEITYMGTTVKIIDFSVLETFRGTFHAIVVFVLWGSYLLRLYKRLPGIIHGFDTSDSSNGVGAYFM